MMVSHYVCIEATFRALIGIPIEGVPPASTSKSIATLDRGCEGQGRQKKQHSTSLQRGEDWKNGPGLWSELLR